MREQAKIKRRQRAAQKALLVARGHLQIASQAQAADATVDQHALDLEAQVLLSSDRRVVARQLVAEHRVAVVQLVQLGTVAVLKQRDRQAQAKLQTALAIDRDANRHAQVAGYAVLHQRELRVGTQVEVQRIARIVHKQLRRDLEGIRDLRQVEGDQSPGAKSRPEAIDVYCYISCVRGFF